MSASATTQRLRNDYPRGIRTARAIPPFARIHTSNRGRTASRRGELATSVHCSSTETTAFLWADVRLSPLRLRIRQRGFLAKILPVSARVTFCQPVSGGVTEFQLERRVIDLSLRRNCQTRRITRRVPHRARHVHVRKVDGCRY